MAGILCIARNLHRRGDHRSPAFVAQSKIASLVQREVVPNGTGGIVTEQKRLKEYGTTPQAPPGCFSVSHREIVGVQPTKKNSARRIASRTAHPLHRGAEPRANQSKTDRPGRRSLQDKNLRAPCKTKLPPLFQSPLKGAWGKLSYRKVSPIAFRFKLSSPSPRRGECPRGHCSQRRRSARRARGAASCRGQSCARAAPCRTRRAAPTDRTRANPESC